MIPKKYDIIHDFDYPDFQPDQVLSADHLNHSFGWNEQQERLTRTNLLGIGIACGLSATRTASGNKISITKGTGVTSEGYLMVLGNENINTDIECTKFVSFNAKKEKHYDLFFTDDKHESQIPIWELLTEEEAKDITHAEILTDNFLDQGEKVLMLFYEMLETDAKNCDTTSCDDKGKTITATVRKLLVSEVHAIAIIEECNRKANSTGSGEKFPDLFGLREIKLPRFDVPQTEIKSSADIINAYKIVFQQLDIPAIATALDKLSAALKDYLGETDEISAAFAERTAQFDFSTIDKKHLLHIQYYYDFFCDLIAAYNELRNCAHELVYMCSPPSALFPRHLFLGKLSEPPSPVKSFFRNYFIPSPILNGQKENYRSCKSLYQRLVRLIRSMEIPDVPEANNDKKIDTNIRITPSLIGNEELGSRAIPYYYDVHKSNYDLLDVWNYDLTKRGRQSLIDGYRISYLTPGDFIDGPLANDLEEYNFLRVEGHVGKPYEKVLRTLKDRIQLHRLPVDVIALQLGSDVSDVIVDDECSLLSIKMQYNFLRTEINCCLKKYSVYLASLKIKDSLTGNKGDIATGIKGISVQATELLFAGKTKPESDLKMNELNEVRNKLKALAVPELLLRSLDDFSGQLKTTTDKKTDALSEKRLIRHSGHLFESGTVGEEFIAEFGKGNLRPDKKNVDTETLKASAIKAHLFLIINHIDELMKFSEDEKILVGNIDKFLDQVAELEKEMSELASRIEEFLKPRAATAEINSFLDENFSDLVEKFSRIIPPQELSRHSEKISLVFSSFTKRQDFEEFISEQKKLNSTTARMKFIQDRHKQLTNAGKVPPPQKPPQYPNDAALKDLLGKLKDFCCLCTAACVKDLKELLAKEIEVLKQQKLFSNFIKKHPGIQHKAGVTMGGTFILVHNGTNPQAGALAADGGSGFGDRIVVADFYLPYRCCSDCTPVNFTVKIPDPLINFSLAPEYCSKDVDVFFETNPVPGEISSVDNPNAVTDNLNGTWTFHPGKVEIPNDKNFCEAHFTYVANNMSKTIKVNVFRFPVVEIKSLPDNLDTQKIHFAVDKPDMVTSVKWNFDDGTSLTGPEVEHVFSKGGKKSVTAEIKNGPCTLVLESSEFEVKERETVKMQMQNNVYCSKELGETFDVSPAGGRGDGEGFHETKSGSGTFVFTPSEVNLNDELQKTVLFNYSPLAGEPQSLSVTVFGKPEGEIIAPLQTGKIVSLKFKALKFVDEFIVDYGDNKPVQTIPGTGITETLPPYPYDEDKTYTVNVTLQNGKCSTPLNPFEVKVETITGNPVRFDCQSFKFPLNKFGKLIGQLNDAKEFKNFYKSGIPEPLPLLPQVEKYFGFIAANLNLPVSEQLVLFSEKENKFNPDWISKLPVNSEVARILSIQLLHIFIDVLTTLSCMKPDDVNKGKIVTEPLFIRIITKAKAFNKPTPFEKSIVELMRTDLNDELSRIKLNNQVKPKFIEAIKEILFVLDKH